MGKRDDPCIPFSPSFFLFVFIIFCRWRNILCMKVVVFVKSLKQLGLCYVQNDLLFNFGG